MSLTQNSVVIQISFRVFIPLDIDSAGKNILNKNGVEIIIGSGNSSDSILKNIHRCDAIIIRGGDFNKEILSLGKDLKILVKHGIGTDNIDLDYCKTKGIIVANDPNSNLNAVIEHVIALILSATKNIVYFDSKIRANKFNESRKEIRNMELRGKILGQIGFGKVGQRVAEIMKNAFGMKIIYFDPYANINRDDMESVNSLEKLFEQSDVINISIPLNSHTKTLINSEVLNLCKYGSIIVNAARGEIINTKHLINSVKEGRIIACGLDVFENEPIEEDNKILEMNEFILSPHNAALTKESVINLSINAANRIVEYLQGDKIKYRIV